MEYMIEFTANAMFFLFLVVIVLVLIVLATARVLSAVGILHPEEKTHGIRSFFQGFC